MIDAILRLYWSCNNIYGTCLYASFHSMTIAANPPRALTASCARPLRILHTNSKTWTFTTIRLGLQQKVILFDHVECLVEEPCYGRPASTRVHAAFRNAGRLGDDACTSMSKPWDANKLMIDQATKLSVQ